MFLRRTFKNLACALHAFAWSFLAMLSAAHADDLPTADQFMLLLNTCAAGSQTKFDAALLGSVRSMYDGSRTTGSAAFKSQGAFLALLPEDKKFEGYRLYIECVKSIVGDPRSSKRNLQADFLRTYTEDTPYARAIEVFGQPRKTKRLLDAEGRPLNIKGSALSAAEFVGEEVDFYVVQTKEDDKAIVAVSPNSAAPATAIPIPYMHMGQEIRGKQRAFHNIDDFRLGDIKELCADNRVKYTNFRYYYIVSNLCYFGRPGGYQHFQFVFWPTVQQVDDCKKQGNELDFLDVKEYSNVKCLDFINSPPDIVLVYFDQKYEVDDLAELFIGWKMGE